MKKISDTEKKVVIKQDTVCPGVPWWKCRCRKGFSLVELMTVLAIITILSAIAFPGLMKWVPNYRLKAAAQQLFADMQKAKMTAVKNNRKVTFNFTTACPGGSYVFKDPGGTVVTSGTMSQGVCLSSSTFTNDASGFSPTGIAAGAFGKVTLKHNKVTRTYQISQSIAGGIAVK